jgi:hypothetical protein
LIGFNLGENAQARMAKWDKTSANEFQANDWNYWIRMEEQHPELFVEMYQFWLVYNP